MSIEHPMCPPSSRRGFLAIAAASAVSAGALAAAAMPPAQDDRKLLELEEKIFHEWREACAFDPEIIRLGNLWTAESDRLYKEALLREVQTGVYLTPQERWEIVTNLPDCIEHSRLCELQEPFIRRQDALIEEMFAMPAHTPEGRRAKVQVLLVCVMGNDWSGVDEETEYPERMARNLLIEFIGGEPGAMLRDQFS